MAKKISVEMVDDLDGTPASETIHFALDGVSYEIDLSEKNAMKLRATFEAWTEKARGTGRPIKRRPLVRMAPGVNLRDVRQWAVQNGHSVAPRGRVAKDIVLAYHQSQGVQMPQFSSA